MTITTTRTSFPDSPALVDAEYRLLWIDDGSRGSCSDAQIFNRSDLKEKIKDCSLGLLASEPLGQRKTDIHDFLLSDNAFAFMPWMLKPYSRRQLTRKENIAKYRIYRGRSVVENAFGILMSQFRVPLGTME